MIFDRQFDIPDSECRDSVYRALDLLIQASLPAELLCCVLANTRQNKNMSNTLNPLLNSGSIQEEPFRHD